MSDTTPNETQDRQVPLIGPMIESIDQVAYAMTNLALQSQPQVQVPGQPNPLLCQILHMQFGNRLLLLQLGASLGLWQDGAPPTEAEIQEILNADKSNIIPAA